MFSYKVAKEAEAIVKLYKYCGLSLERCIEDLQDVRGESGDLADRIREIWDPSALPREQRKQS